MSIIDDLYEILQEHVIDQLGEMIMYNKKPTLAAGPQNEKIQTIDFDIYIAKLKQVRILVWNNVKFISSHMKNTGR